MSGQDDQVLRHRARRTIHRTCHETAITLIRIETIAYRSETMAVPAAGNLLPE